MRIKGLANNLCILDDDITDTEVVKKLLQVVPDRLTQVAISIETLLDVSTLSIEEVAGHLQSMEQRYERSNAGGLGNKLFLTEEEWMARMRRREQESSQAGGNSAHQSTPH